MHFVLARGITSNLGGFGGLSLACHLQSSPPLLTWTLTAAKSAFPAFDPFQSPVVDPTSTK